MAKINAKTGVATLTLAESGILGTEPGTVDGREVDRVRRSVREECQEVADRERKSIEVYACARHGGHVVDVVEPSFW